MSDVNLEFLDLPAQRVLQLERNTHRNLNWAYNKWVIDSSSEDSKIYLWTFSGEKINRTLSLLFSIELETELEYDFKKIVIEEKKGNTVSINDVEKYISLFKSKSEQELDEATESKIEKKWFSKFSDCVPELLAKKAIREKDFDVAGLIRELKLIAVYQ